MPSSSSTLIKSRDLPRSRPLVRYIEEVTSKINARGDGWNDSDVDAIFKQLNRVYSRSAIKVWQLLQNYEGPTLH